MKKKAALDAIKTIRGGLDALEEAIKAPTPKKRTVKKKTTTTKKKKRKVGSISQSDIPILSCTGERLSGCNHTGFNTGGRCGGGVSSCGR